MAEYSGGGDPKRSLELLWGVTVRASRGPKARLSVPEIVRAAMLIADAEGLGGLSMRQVAGKLDIAPMSLYTYVPSKAELVDLLVDAACAEFTDASDVSGDWRTRVTEMARRNWALYHRHSWLLHIAQARPVLGPHSLAKYDYEVRTLEDADLSDVEKDSVITLVNGHVQNSARADVETAELERLTGMTDRQWWDARAGLLAELIPDGAFTASTAVGSAAGVEHDAASDPLHAFEFGLARILDGIASFIERNLENRNN